MSDSSITGPTSHDGHAGHGTPKDHFTRDDALTPDRRWYADQEHSSRSGDENVTAGEEINTQNEELDPGNETARLTHEVQLQLEEYLHRLRALERSWKAPSLVFHGSFGPSGDDSPWRRLRHRDGPDNYGFLASKNETANLIKTLRNFRVPSFAHAALELKQTTLELAEALDQRHERVAKEQWCAHQLQMRLYHQAKMLKIDTSSHFFNLSGLSASHLMSMLSIIAVYYFRGLTRDASHFLLEAIGMIMVECVTGFCVTRGIDCTNVADAVLGDWSVDIRTVMKRFNLLPEFVEWAACLHCHALHTIDPGRHDFVEICGYRGCTGHLFRHSIDNVNALITPLSPYRVQTPSTWIGRLLSRPRIINSLITHASASVSGMEHDFWHASAPREFLDHDGRPFFRAALDAGEIHLAFGLFVDWFNAFGKRSSRGHSSGVLYLVCFNLPPELRYRVENMCLIAVIPGPKEPALQALNHYLAPVVDDLLSLWKPGVVLSRTATAVEVLVRGALLPLIADTPAIRKAQGTLSFSSKVSPCSVCAISSSELNDFDYEHWKRRSWAEHMEHATAWRDAPTQAARKTLEDLTGIRWSELLRLPYWNPTVYAIVDAMHNLFLGDIASHLEKAWGMQWIKPRVDPDGGGVATSKTNGRLSHTPDQQQEMLSNIVAAWKRHDGDFLSGKHTRKDYLLAVAHANKVPVSTGGSKREIATIMIGWLVMQSHDLQIRQPEPRPYAVHVFEGDDLPADSGLRILDNEELEAIWPIASRISLPTWLNRGPQYFGKPGIGTIKADSWRTIGTVLLPLVLILLWSKGGRRHTHFHAILLDNFLHLVAAVNLATMRSTSNDRRMSYLEHLQKYARGLVHTIPNYPVPANLHLSFHIPEILELFGPVRSWWTFPFERYIGVMRRHTNGKSGQLEMTFFNAFTSACNLRILMEDITDSGLIPSFTALFNRFFQRDVAGTGSRKPAPAQRRQGKLTLHEATLLAHRLNGSAVHTRYAASATANCVQVSRNVTMLSSFSLKETTFSDSTSSQTNCDVIAHVSSLPGAREEVAGRITAIFEHTRVIDNGAKVTETFVVFRPFMHLSPAEAACDPFRTFTGFNARSYRNQLSKDAVIIKANDLVAHFAGLLYKMKPTVEGGHPGEQTLFLIEEDTNLPGHRLPEYIAVLSLCRD
ncbi:unnamed protein product [Peniophora sp. CBMAI 1063]|nr:unnamed protein product [Peniophora sp. CBMAI 1063]